MKLFRCQVKMCEAKRLFSAKVHLEGRQARSFKIKITALEAMSNPAPPRHSGLLSQ